MKMLAPYIAKVEPYNMKNNYNNVLEPVNSTSVSSREIRKQFCLAWTIIVFVLIDIILEIVFNYVNPLSMGDNAAIIAIATIFLIHSFKKQSVLKTWISILIILICFVGFGVRGFSMEYVFRSFDTVIVSIVLINFLMLCVRTILVFLCAHMSWVKINSFFALFIGISKKQIIINYLKNYDYFLGNIYILNYFFIFN